MPSVVSLYASNHIGACEIYRVVQPLTYLAQRDKKWKTGWISLDAQRQLVEAHGWVPWIKLLQNADLLVFPRLFSSGEDFSWLEPFFTLIREYGVRTVYETDDDYTNAYRQVVTGDALKFAGLCDSMTVTTSFLGETMKTVTGLDYHVLPNMLDPRWKDTSHAFKRKGDQRLIIGLAGTKTHVDDWLVLKDVLPRILRKHEQVTLIVGNFHPDYLKGLPNTEYWPGLKYEDYVEYVRCCDIILAPVDPADQFNMGKSPIKAIEGMGAARKTDQQNRFCGAAVIATDNPIYRLAVDPNETGLLVDYTPEAWFDAIDQLITDVPFRQKLQLQGYESVWRNYDISKGWIKWERAYRTILKQPIRKAAVQLQGEKS